MAAGLAYNMLGKKTDAEVLDKLDTFLDGVEISALYDDGEYLWAGTGEGIYLLNKDTGETVKKLDADIKMIFSARIVRTEDGSYMVGHDKGLSVFDDNYNEIKRFSSPEIPAGRVNDIYEDKEGVWAGSQEGAAHLSKKDGSWEVDEVLTVKNGLTEPVVEVIEKVGDEVWFGSYLSGKKGGISIKSADGWKYINTDDGLPHSFINAILPLSDEKVLIGTGQMIYGGLALLEKGASGNWSVSRTWDQSDGLTGMKVRTLFLDSHGRLWVTSETDGLIIVDSVDALNKTPLEGQTISVENGLSDVEIKCIIESDKCFWLGSKYGLNRLAKD